MRLEALGADLRRLGYAVGEELPRAHALPHPQVDAYTTRTRELVELWGRHDFERFGCSRDLADACLPGRDGLSRASAR